MDAATEERDVSAPQELIRSIGADLSLLIRQQVALAKQEFRGIAAEKAAGGGLLVGAAILGLFRSSRSSRPTCPRPPRGRSAAPRSSPACRSA
jgi:hypothetical protein